MCLMKSKLWSLLTVALACSLLVGCKQGETPATGGKLRVACTTTMVGDLVKRIGGDRVDVRVIMGAGVDPHTYKPTPGDVAELASAPIVFYNGLHLEGKMVEVFEQKMADRSHAIG